MNELSLFDDGGLPPFPIWDDVRRPDLAVGVLASGPRAIETSGKARIALRRNGPRTIDKGIVVCVCKCGCKRA